MKEQIIITKAIGYFAIFFGILAVVIGFIYPHAWHNLFLGFGFIWLGKVHLDEAKQDERQLNNHRDSE